MDGDWKTIKVRVTEPVPDILGRWAGYALYDLRSCLEHLAIIAARQHGCPIADLQWVKFPFSKDESGLNKMLFTSVKGRSPALSSLFGDRFTKKIVELKPYPAGNDFLWRFSRLANHDRHVEVVPASNTQGVIQGMGNVTIRNATLSGAAFILGGFSNLHDGIPIAGPMSLSGEFKHEGQLKVAAQICFGEATEFSAEPVVPILRKSVQMIRDIVQSVEAELNR